MQVKINWLKVKEIAKCSDHRGPAAQHICQKKKKKVQYDEVYKVMCVHCKFVITSKLHWVNSCVFLPHRHSYNV